jgi:hypothetical protein
MEISKKEQFNLTLDLFYNKSQALFLCKDITNQS